MKRQHVKRGSLKGFNQDIHSKILPSDLQPKAVKNYRLTPDGVIATGPIDPRDEILQRLLRNSNILVAEKLIERGMVGRAVTIGTTPTPIIQSKFARMYKILNPSLSVGLTNSGTLFASTSRVAGGPTASVSLGVANYDNIHLFLDVSVIAAGAVVIDALTLDPISGLYAITQLDIFTSPTTVSTNYAYLGGLGVGTDFEVQYTTTGTTTFSVGYVLKDGLPGTGSGLAKTIYLGNSSVTTQAGMPLLEGDSMSMFLGENAELWAIATSSLEIRVFELQ